MTLRRIGVVGIGNMGLAMALRLRDRGFDVAVRDVDPVREALATTERLTARASAARLAADRELVIVAVVDAAQTEAVLFGPDGVVAAPTRPALVILCPTIAPGDVERFAARLAEARIATIDAPMSGGPARARDGSMSLMLAGPTETLERAAAVLDALSSRQFRIGERVGDGARVKLVNNLLAAINLAGAAEALHLAERIGLDPGRTLDVIEQSSGQSWIGSDRLRRAFADDWAPRAHTRLLAKDSALALQMATAAAVPTALGAPAAALFARACASGFEGWDDASVLALLRRDVGGV